MPKLRISISFCNSKSSCQKTCYVVRFFAIMYVQTTKQKMQDKELPNWNVRTFLDMANSIRHMGRTALMAHELSHLNVDVSSLSEVRHADDDR